MHVTDSTQTHSALEVVAKGSSKTCVFFLILCMLLWIISFIITVVFVGVAQSV